MTDHQFLILQTLNDNKDKLIGENNLRDRLKDDIGREAFWDAFSPMDKMEFFIEDNSANIKLSPVGQNSFNKENERRTQQAKDEKIKREKLYHDAFVSKWKAKSFWWVFLGSFIIGSISLCGQLGLIPLPHLSIWTTKQSEKTSHSTDPAQSQTALSGQTINISSNPIGQTNTQDTLTNDKK
jgi:hypothetical protein